MNNSDFFLCRQAFVNQLLAGKKELSFQEIDVRKKGLDLEFLSPPFVVISIAPFYENVKYEEKDVLFITVCDYIQKWIELQGFQSYCVNDIYNNTMILLSINNKQVSSSYIDDLFIKLHNDIFLKYDLESFIGIGSVVDNYEQISESASDASKMLSYKYQYSEKGVINISNLIHFQYNVANSSGIAFDRVIGCFQDGNLGKMEIRLNELVEGVRHQKGVSKSSIRRTLIEVTIRLLNIASYSGVDVDAVLGERDPYHWILEQNHTEIITEWIMKLSSELLGLMSREFQQVEKETMKKAFAYIDQHIGDATLGLVEISEAVGLSGSYFSQLFKSENEIGLNAYIVEKRLKIAKDLLITTNYKIEDIALQAGFTSGGYFSRVFGRHFGISPTDYRRKYSES